MDLKVLDDIAKDQEKTKVPSRPRFAMVTAVNAENRCKIQVDGDSAAYEIYYPSLYQASVGHRVFIEYVGNSIIILGKV